MKRRAQRRAKRGASMDWCTSAPEAAFSLITGQYSDQCCERKNKRFDLNGKINLVRGSRYYGYYATAHSRISEQIMADKEGD